MCFNRLLTINSSTNDFHKPEMSYLKKRVFSITKTPTRSTISLLSRFTPSMKLDEVFPGINSSTTSVPVNSKNTAS